jgi:hypothetical protein
MVSQIINWSHTGIVGNQNPAQKVFYVRYQLPGQSQINISEVANIMENPNSSFIGIKINDGSAYELLNYNLNANDYFYAFNTSQINQVAGLVNGKPAIRLGNSPLAVLRNLGLSLSFHSPDSNIVGQVVPNQDTPVNSVYSIGGDARLTSNNIPVHFLSGNSTYTDIWAQFGQGNYTVNTQNGGYGSIISSQKLIITSSGSDTQLVDAMGTDNQLLFNGIHVNIVTDPTLVTSIQNGATISVLTDNTQQLQASNDDVWMLSMRTLSIYRPLSSFVVNGQTYYMIAIPNGTFLNQAQIRVAIVRPSGVIADSAFADTPVNMYVPCTFDQIPSYVSAATIPIVNSNQIAEWQSWINQAPIVQNLSSQNRTILNAAMDFVNSLIKRFRTK